MQRFFQHTNIKKTIQTLDTLHKSLESDETIWKVLKHF